MAVAATTVETYDVSVLREDLQEAYSMISSEECPFHTAIGTKSVTQPKFEWPVVDLAPLEYANRVVEGDDAPGANDATLALRMANYTQISDKTISVSHTSDASDAAAENIQELAEQVALKLRELKRDCEGMALDNVAAAPGSSGNARTSAGLPAFLRTNLHLEVGNVAPTLSGTTEGYPDDVLTEATTPVPLTEDNFNNVIQQCWEAGADPTIAMVNANNKRVISATFTGASTRYKDAVDKKLVAAIDIYTSDFGELQVVPNRFQPAINRAGTNDEFAVYILDPNFARIAELESTKQKPLAETGHSRKRLIWREWGLQIDNEAAHGAIYGTNGASA